MNSPGNAAGVRTMASGGRPLVLLHGTVNVLLTAAVVGVIMLMLCMLCCQCCRQQSQTPVPSAASQRYAEMGLFVTSESYENLANWSPPPSYEALTSPESFDLPSYDDAVTLSAAPKSTVCVT